MSTWTIGKKIRRNDGGTWKIERITNTHIMVCNTVTGQTKWIKKNQIAKSLVG
jgi:hypothetical protein